MCSQTAEPHCDAACQHTLGGTWVKVHTSFSSHTEALEAPQEEQPLLCLFQDALSVEGPREGVYVCAQEFKTDNISTDVG